jgi:hypothetical protein
MFLPGCGSMRIAEFIEFSKLVFRDPYFAAR